MSPRRLFSLVVGLGAASLAVPSVCWIGPVNGIVCKSNFNMLSLTTTTVLLVTWLVGSAKLAPEKTLSRLLLGAPFAGALNACVALWLAAASEPSEPFGVYVIASFVAAVLGFPIGLLYGLGLAIAAIPLKRLSPLAHDTLDRSSVWFGFWLIIVASLGAHLSEGVPMLPIWIPTLAVGAVLFLSGGARVMIRRRWLTRVRLGIEPGWRILARRPGVHDNLAPLEADRANPFEWCDGVLALWKPGRLGPYRDAVPHHAVAKVWICPPPSFLAATAIGRKLQCRPAQQFVWITKVGVCAAILMVVVIVAIGVVLGVGMTGFPGSVG